MKRYVVLGLVLVLAMNGTAWAQGPQGIPQDPMQTRAVVSCGVGRNVEIPYTWDEWNQMTGQQQAAVCAKSYTGKSVQFKPVNVAPHQYSPKLGLAGGVTFLVGMLMALPQGETDYILGDAFCSNVTDYSVTVDYGACTAVSKKYGLITMGAGVVMMAIGFHTVHVSPMVGHNVAGVSGTIKWGEKK